MSVKVSVGPPHLAISWGHIVLLTEPNGQISWPTQNGLYFFDTRLISSWRLYANGEEWDLLNSGSVTHYASRVFLINRIIPTENGDIPPRTVNLVLSRSIGEGVHEDLDLVNNGLQPVHFNLEIAIRGDFADIFEVRSGHIVRRGRITSDWSFNEMRLQITYQNKDFYRDVTVIAANSDAPLRYANGRITFEVDIAPAQGWHACLLYELNDGKHRFAAPKHCIANAPDSELGYRVEHWRRTVLKIETNNPDFSRAFDQAVADTAALRLPIPGTSHTDFVPAAGVPWFMALFGRDSLIASLQNILVYPYFARRTLEVLGSLQATERDDIRDAEPGKILHELRQGELAHFKLIPHTPYFGTADATPLYLILLHAAWRCTGDLGVIEEHLETAQRCLEWIDKCGDRDGDGFQEYQTRSPVGYENQGWKDSGEAIVYPDGMLVKGPKALCELQGYVYDAWLGIAEIYEILGRSDAARILREKAQELYARFNERFWDEKEGFYALALDGDKKQVLSIASNPGHCLWSGIVPPERAHRVVGRLMQPDMWSGWGVRTLSAKHPAYNPNSYQNGSVWPHDNAIIALGFRRYGFAQEACRIAYGVTNAASYFVMQQLPELYAGIERTNINFPVQYLGANVPQAWAAGSFFFLLQSILGIRPDAPHGTLYVDPELPDWLTEFAVLDLRLGDQVFDIKFQREGDETTFKVSRGNPAAVVRRKFDLPA
jgi:glycogen debranching enzyme